MKRIAFAALLSGVSTVALAADAALETAPVTVPVISGYGEFYAGGLAMDYDMTGEFGGSDSDSATTLGGAARVNIPFGERWNFQVDATLDHFKRDTEVTGYGAAGHLFWRDPNSFAVGGFVGVQEYDNDEDGATTWTVGPEAQFYVDNLTLYGQVFYSEMDMSGNDLDLYGVRAVARYFVQPNLRLDGEFGFKTASESDSVASLDIDVFTAALQASYRFDTSPWTVFGRYQFDRATMEISGIDAQELTTDSHKFVVGIRASFGTGTLLEEDRYGATMDTGRANYTGF